MAESVCEGSGLAPVWDQRLNLYVCPQCPYWGCDPDERPAVIPEHEDQPRRRKRAV